MPLFYQVFFNYASHISRRYSSEIFPREKRTVMGSQGTGHLFRCRFDNKTYSNERYNKELLLLFGQANQRKKRW